MSDSTQDAAQGRQRLAVSVAELVEWRRALHAIPETAFTEVATAEYVARVLATLGFEVATGVGGTGVVGSLTRGRGDRAVGLRADLDALPITEVPGRVHGSRHPGAMHACGHDGHLTMVLGAAAELARSGGFEGTVRVVCQPAEEPGRGAQAMIDDGLFQRFPVDAMVGLHNLPGLPAGTLHTRAGAIMASEDNFAIEVTGRGGHASAPHLVIDPLVVGAEIVLALQTVIARNVDPAAAAVLSCTGFDTDGARNAIPTRVRITGDTRSFDPAVSRLLEERIRTISASLGAAYGATCEVTYTREFAPTVNDAESARLLAAAGVAALGADHVVPHCDPITASEDFGVYAAHVPAAFGFLGNGVTAGEGGTPLHSSDYDFNDAIAPAGVAVYARLVRDLLPVGPSASRRTND